MRDPAEFAGPAASAPARERFWSNVREALRGSEQDVAAGAIFRRGRWKGTVVSRRRHSIVTFRR